tara:strand:+ start:169 stop:675 length:507 start_codon:yes stop_codon:yes gene_type:complete
MTVSDLIKSFQKSNLIAQCPTCNGEFLLSKAFLFDGTKQFPPKAEKKKLVLTEELDGINQQIKDRLDDLKKFKISVDKKSEQQALVTGLGKVMENVLPYYKDFNSQVPLADCRFIAAQIDIIVFEGVSNNNIKNITFMDAKTGKKKLEPNQRQIRDAVNNEKVRLELF